ncbi:MAG: RNA polymerase sigma factor [candidate division Zixibacteria bacterium]
MTEPDINYLYNQVRRGDATKEKHLFQLLSDKFLYFALHRIWDKADAEEIVQNALMTIHKEYIKIDFKVSFAAWAYKVLNNKILDYIQTKRRRGSLMRDAIRDNRLPRPAPLVENPELKRRLLFCLEKIGRRNIRYARILNLHYQGFSTTEICEKIKLTKRVFYTSLFRARTLLVSCLKNEDTDQ